MAPNFRRFLILVYKQPNTTATGSVLGVKVRNLAISIAGEVVTRRKKLLPPRAPYNRKRFPTCDSVTTIRRYESFGDVCRKAETFRLYKKLLGG